MEMNQSIHMFLNKNKGISARPVKEDRDKAAFPRKACPAVTEEKLRLHLFVVIFYSYT